LTGDGPQQSTGRPLANCVTGATVLGMKTATTRITYKIEVYGEMVERSRTVAASEVEQTIDRLLDRGAFDFSTEAVSQ
jgi:hypothetical protein